MGRWLTSWVDESLLSPHGFCLAWEPGLLWTHAGADLLIAFAYFSISFALLRLVRRRRDVVYPWVFAIFAAFITACGATHLISIVVLWEPLYWLDGLVKAVTAILSVATAILLWPLLPRIIALPSPSELQAVNRKLAEEIEARDRVARQLQESEARFRGFFESSPDALAVVHQDARGRFCFEAVNPAMSALLGQPTSGIEGRPVAAVLGRQEGEVVERLYGDCIARGDMVRTEVERHLHDGNHALESVLVAVPDGSSGRRRVLESTRDVTERRCLESRLVQAQKMEAVGQLAGGVAHDFNNLLQAALVNIERAELVADDPDRVRETLSFASTILSRGSLLIKQLLSVSRRQPLQAEPLRMDQAVARVRELLERAAGDAVTVVATGPAAPWHAMLDAAQFEAALLNLVLNAHDAMPMGGVLEIETLNTVLAEAQAGALDLPPGEYCSLVVRDNGSGMSPDILSRVFEPFFTTKDNGRGSGLGLPQVHSFVRRSGGGIAIESEPGQGTTVRLCFPRCPAPMAGPVRALERPAAHAALPPATILLVEDDQRVLQQTRLALGEAGLTVIDAADGASAIGILAQRADIDIVLSDVVLAGGLSGIDVAREARRRYPDMPILLVSGHAVDVLDKHEARNEFELLPKPYRQAELKARLVQLLAPQES